MASRRSRWIQLLVLIAGGPLLAVGGCALFLNTLNFNGNSTNPGQVAGAIGFIAGLAMLFVGLLWGFVLLVMRIFKSDKPAQPAGPDPPAHT